MNITANTVVHIDCCNVCLPQAIHSFMCNQPEVNPVATCSTSDYVADNSAAAGSENREEDDIKKKAAKVRKMSVSDKAHGENSDVEEKDTAVRRKKMAVSERRHQENLERKDKFLALFEKLVDKL